MSNSNIVDFTDLLQIEGINAQGFGTIAKIPMRDRRLTAEAKAVYAYIAPFAGSGTTAFPSASLMQFELCMNQERYLKHRKLLVMAGYLKIKQDKYPKGHEKAGRFKRNIYTLITHPVAIVAPVETIGTTELAAPGKSGYGSPNPDSPYPENPCTENKGYIINSLIINSSNKQQQQQQEEDNARVRVSHKGYERVIAEKIENEYQRGIALEIAKKHGHNDASLHSILTQCILVTNGDPQKMGDLLDAILQQKDSNHSPSWIAQRFAKAWQKHNDLKPQAVSSNAGQAQQHRHHHQKARDDRHNTFLDIYKKQYGELCHI